jgi:hypothetical protein
VHLSTFPLCYASYAKLCAAMEPSNRRKVANLLLFPTTTGGSLVRAGSGFFCAHSLAL